MIDRTFAGEYADRFNKYGPGEESIHQARAICHIADMITDIAYEIRALREHISNEEGDTE